MVASQTVPILAISPIIVVAIKAGWLSVALMSAYLTFFPVTIASLRGPARRGPAGPGAVSLVRRVALGDPVEAPPADLGAVPVLVAPGRRGGGASSARSSASIPAGIADGLGSAIVNYNQYYVTAPARLWVTIIMCTFVGLAFVGIVRVAETSVTRGRYRTMDAQ